MKFPPLLLNFLRRGLRIVFFHPMFYIAILFHWGIMNLPSPVQQAEVEEEELPESIPVASIASLGKISSEPENTGSEDKNAKEEKPTNPLAEALVKSDPELAKQVEEKKKKEEEEKRKKEEALRKKKEEEAKKQEEQANKDEESEEENQLNEEEADGEIGEENQEETESDRETATLTREEYKIFLGFFKQPELFFSQGSISEFTAEKSDQLVQQQNIQHMFLLPTVTDPELAIAITKGTQPIKTDEHQRIVDLLKDYEGYEFNFVQLDRGFGEIYELIRADGTRKFVSFVKSKKRTLRSSRMFIEYKQDPRS